MVQVVSAPTPQALASPERKPFPRVGLTTPRLTVVIVNYCQWENTAALVHQLRRTSAVRKGAMEIVIVDNHSPRHPLMTKLRRLPGVSLRRWRRNRGFARAVNEGCRLSQGQWFLLLNPDLSVTGEFLQGVLSLADELSVREPRAGIVGFHLRNSDGSRQFSTGGDLTLARTLAGLARPRARRKYQATSVPQRSPVAWVTGCCLLVRRDCWLDLGGFNEDFFLYYEDVDLCHRARARGWTVWFEPNLQAVHHNPIHARTVTPALRLITRHSLLAYSSRHWPGWQFRLLAVLVCLEAWVRGLWAWWRKDRTTAALFQELAALARDLARQRKAQARRRLERVVQEHAQSLVSNVRTPEARELCECARVTERERSNTDRESGGE